jgi:hypothetical protein
VTQTPVLEHGLRDRLSNGAFVGLSSCTGGFSCFWRYGYNSPDSTIIQDGACKGFSACDDIARIQGKSLIIEPNACVGEQSCSAIGRDYAESVIIDAGACDSNFECSGFSRIAGPNVQCFAETTPTCQN